MKACEVGAAGFAVTVLLGVAAPAIADPIAAESAVCYRAGWFPAEGVNCDRVCERAGMSAEGLSLGPGEPVFLCRHGGAETPGFGEQSVGVCRIGLAEGFLATLPSFECLCAASACPDQPSGGLQQPDFAEDCLPFSTAGTSVEVIDGRWKIVEGSHWMFDFSDSEAEAREAYKAIHFNGFNQVCYIGRPAPSMTYLKTGSRVPTGDDTGFDCLPFDTASVGIQPEGEEWLLFSGNSRMLMLPNEEEARHALSVITSYGLNRQCFVGRPAPAFEFWLAR